MDERVTYWPDVYEDGTHLTMWRCERCKTVRGTTNASLSELHFGAHWKTPPCTRALQALRGVSWPG